MDPFAPMPEVGNFSDVAPMIFIYLLYILVVAAIGIAFYVMQSLGLYSIAKRRGINSPWLAWIPVGSGWIMGCISDQYRYVAKGQVKNKRKILLILNLLTLGIGILFVILYVGMIVNLVLHATRMDVLSIVTGVMAASLVMSGLAIAAAVIQYMALYDTFVSCDPNTGTVFLVLSILFGLQPIFLLACRNKDLGMPPRTYPYHPEPYVPQGPM